jgi:hypothetical protein
MRATIFLLSLLAFLVGQASAQPRSAFASDGFGSIELQGGGIVTVRHGQTRSVTVSYENLDRRVCADGDRLVIAPCRGACRDHHIEVDIVTPSVSRLAVTGGGILHVVGDFPGQATVAASVSGGGTLDIRWLDASNVTASVSRGGRILTRPGRQLAASISDGGDITYWGDAAVTSSVQRGGAVVRGTPAELRTPVPLPRRVPQGSPKTDTKWRSCLP